MNRKRTLFVSLMVALLTGAFAVPGVQMANGATERLANGNFEGGFYSTPVGFVGNHWKWFHNGGQATYGFYDDTWAPVVYDGRHSQLIEINTFCRGGSDPDRYAGIYQTVAVVPGERYELSLHGMLRALEDDPDRACCNYRVEYGIDYSGGDNWKAVTDWYELPWNTVHPRLLPGSMEWYSTSITATTNRVTVFVRVWKKWGTASRELDVNIDAISLKGTMPTDVDMGQDYPEVEGNGEANGGGTHGSSASGAGLTVSFEVPDYPVKGWTYTVPVFASNDVGVTKLMLYENGNVLGQVEYDVGPLSVTYDFTWTPSKSGLRTLKAVAYDAGGARVRLRIKVRVGKEGQFLTNGDFEDGFDSMPVGAVGSGWGWFHNGGAATYGFYDETWAPVIHRGSHSQLIEINTFCRAASNADRYSGIYQMVDDLTPGATYNLRLYGMLRVLADDEDRQGYNYRVEWGYDPNGGTDWSAVTNWIEIPWDKVYTRLDPGTMDRYSASFEAPSSEITLFLRAWKKWGTARKELDVNLDTITLRGYQ